MTLDPNHERLLEYLKKEGPTNTFRIARRLNTKRHKVIEIIKELEKKGYLEFKSNKARFLKFPTEKKVKITPKPKKKEKIKPNILEELQIENKKLYKRLSELEQKLKIPKIIKKTIVKKVPIEPSEENRKLQKKVLELEKILKELEQRFKKPKVKPQIKKAAKKKVKKKKAHSKKKFKKLRVMKLEKKKISDYTKKFGISVKSMREGFKKYSKDFKKATLKLQKEGAKKYKKIVKKKK